MGEAILTLAASPWVLPLLFVLCTVDGFFPPVPSESVVIALAATSVTGHGPPLAAVVAVAALGAHVGDLIAYRIGTRVPLTRIPWLRGERAARATERLASLLRRRGAALIVGARYVPVGRVAVSMTAGATGYPWRRFVAVAVLAAASWSGYSVLIGLAAGTALGSNPLLAAGVGVGVGLSLGVGVDAVVRRIEARRARDRVPV
ncbi:DedA family protein [Pseudonocardia endophytica]|uniref:Membrane protein DedA with SNARE-associated domain n=1 Tax=Pseudonocardia endophytica TaxID=401976 RepID=A0A4R1HTN1_PSEEN|nr:VTT domain-containing protein [Pseudonocardia endophytica]TCK20782.1 membrane protein DedA with SNARE-associated domain [Pseudonocardia endophytica]